MSVGIFTDKKHLPTQAEVEQVLGSRLPMWHQIIDLIRATYAPEEDFHYLYGKQYGWAQRFRVKSKMLINLYPNQGYFTAQVNLPEATVQQALQSPLGQHTQAAIARAIPYPEGCWIFITVDCEEDLRDIQRLLALRSEVKKIQKQAG